MTENDVGLLWGLVAGRKGSQKKVTTEQGREFEKKKKD